MDIMLDALSTDGKAVWIYWSWWSNASVYEVALYSSCTSTNVCFQKADDGEAITSETNANHSKNRFGFIQAFEASNTGQAVELAPRGKGFMTECAFKANVLCNREKFIV